MPRPQPVRYEATTELQVWVLKLDALQSAFAWDDLHGQKFT
jgi:hypothetical protein